MNLQYIAAQLNEGASKIDWCIEKIEEGKRAEAMLPDLMNKQATLSLSMKYWLDRETERAMPLETFLENVREMMKEGAINDEDARCL